MRLYFALQGNLKKAMDHAVQQEDINPKKKEQIDEILKRGGPVSFNEVQSLVEAIKTLKIYNGPKHFHEIVADVPVVDKVVHFGF